MFSWFFRNNLQATAEIASEDISKNAINYDLSSEADETAVVFSYLYLLGRTPENNAAIQDALSVKRTINQLKSDTLSSEEYHRAVKSQNFKFLLNQYLTCKSEKIKDKYHVSNSSKEILIMQTSDADRYKEILSVSSKFNRIYAKKHGIIYKDFVGIKRGTYPHHAMFNRIHLLKEYVEQNFTGWVFYIDADAVIRNPDFDLRLHLNNLRIANKCMTLHTVYQPCEKEYKWWDVNDGCFAIDLSSERARCVIEAWAGIFTDLYSIDDYKSSDTWSNSYILDDQTALWHVLRHLNMESHVDLTDIQGDNGYTQQFLRISGISISSDDDLKSRTKQLNEFGIDIYGHQDTLLADLDD